MPTDLALNQTTAHKSTAACPPKTILVLASTAIVVGALALSLLTRQNFADPKHLRVVQQLQEKQSSDLYISSAASLDEVPDEMGAVYNSILRTSTNWAPQQLSPGAFNFPSFPVASSQSSVSAAQVSSAVSADRAVLINGEAFEKLEENSVEVPVTEIARFTGNKELGLHSLQKKGLVSETEQEEISSSDKLVNDGESIEAFRSEPRSEVLIAAKTSTTVSADREIIINGEAIEKLEESSIEVPVTEIARFTGNKELGLHSLSKKGILSP